MANNNIFFPLFLYLQNDSILQTILIAFILW